MVTKTGSNEIDQHYARMQWGETKMVLAEPETGSVQGAETETGGVQQAETVNSSFSLCLANTDNDSSYMNYAGEHYYRYTDPKVLAVLASPPYFKDLLDRNDLSGNYAESNTSYSSTTGTESGSIGGTTITVGAYVSFEQEISVFGVTIGKTEAEAVVTSGFTWETEHTSSLEQTVSYSATSGEDKVALYSIPMEIYQYESYVPDENGKYEKVITEVNIPHEACVKLLDLSEYETIAEDYSILPTIAESVLRHEIGDPATYPSGTAGYNVIAQYTGTPASVGFTSKDGGDTITQEIAMSKSNSNSYSYVGSVEAKAGAGLGGVTVGVIAGFEGTGGTIHISTEGSSFSGELQAMPAEAKPYGYNMNWKIFCYKYKSGKMEFPVVSYLVTDVQQPASLPEDFEQDVAETTDESVTLRWSYDKYVSGFQIYRYYEFPDGSVSYRLEYVPFSKGVEKNGRYEFSFTDKGLSPYTEYLYQIQTESTYNPKVSIYSEPISCRTKTTLGYPKMTVSGLITDGKDAGKLAIYPDAEGKAIVKVEVAETYKSLSYQWQKLVGGEWKNLPAYKTNELTIANASATDKGTYRCRVNAIYFDTTSQKEFSISAYTQAIETVYTKRTPAAVLVAKAQQYGDNLSINGIQAEIELYSASLNNATAPTGTVTFTIEGKDYEHTKTVTLKSSRNTKSYDMGNDKTENKYYATATADVKGLAEGIYTVKYYYSGDNVFKDKTQEIGQIVAVGSATGYVLNMQNAQGQNATGFTYGDVMVPKLYTVTANTDGISKTDEYMNPVTYQYQEEKGTTPKDWTAGTKLDAGTYTLYAYLGDIGSEAAEKTAVASVSFNIAKKALTVSAVAADNITDPTDPKQAPELKTDVDGVTADALDVTYQAYNSAGNKVSFTKDTDPGNYTIMPCFLETIQETTETVKPESETKRANYEISFVSAIYTVIGQTYPLKVSTERYQDVGSQLKDVGTAAISATGEVSGLYTKGTVIQLYAKPDEGYEVEKWTVTVKEGSTQTHTQTHTAEQMKSAGQNPSRLNISMEPGETEVKVYFKVKETRLHLDQTPGGSISCTSDSNFASGAVVRRGAEFDFKAVPEAGYTFGRWIISETGFNPVYQPGTLAEEGKSEVKIMMGTNDISLRASFVRDSYTVNLQGNVTAYYYKADGVSSEEQEKIFLTSGKAVKGDTIIYVTPKTGYVAAEGASITINGVPTGKTKNYDFQLTADTTISLETTREQYSVSASVAQVGETTDAGSVVITTDGIETESGSSVDGGSRVVFRAVAKRGYVFDHWSIGEDDSKTDDTYILEEIGAPAAVTAVFKANASHTVTAEASPASRGKLVYTLYDIYGDIIEESTDYSGVLTMYEGESIEIAAVPNGGSMVEQWIFKEDGKETKFVSAAKKYPGGRVMMQKADLEFKAVLVSSTYYKLYFHAQAGPDENVNGSLTATADGASIITGGMVPGGADVTFTAVPNAGYMVESWTITQGEASVTPTEENTVTVKDDAGDGWIMPSYEMNGFIGHQTVRVYLTPRATRNLSISGNNAKVDINYVTPITVDDATNPADTTADVRINGTVMLTIVPKEGFATSLEDVKAAFAGFSQTVSAEYREDENTYHVVLKGVTADNDKIVDIDSFVNPLYRVTASGLHCEIGSMQASKKADRAADNMVRAGSNVTFTLTPSSGYGTSATELEDLALGRNLTAAYGDGVYHLTLKNITDDTELSFTMDKLYRISASGGCALSDFGSTKSCETAAPNQARSGANVTFKLTPKEGYQLNNEALAAWSRTVSGTQAAPTMKLQTTLNEDQSLNVEIRGICTDITVPYNLFTPIATGGGGGGAFPMPPEQQKTDEQNKITVEQNVSVSGRAETKVLVEAEAEKQKDGEGMLLTLTEEQQEALIRTAAEKKADEIVIKNGVLDETLAKAAETTDVRIEKKLLEEILTKTEAVLTIETPNGKVQFDREALRQMTAQAGKAKVSELTLRMKKETTTQYRKIVGKTASLLSIQLFAGETRITNFGEGKILVKLAIPQSLAGRELTVLYLGKNGRTERFDGEVTIEKALEENGKISETKYYAFRTNHFSLYALAQKEIVDSYQKAQKTIAGVKQTSLKLSAKASAATVKLSWKKAKGYKVDAYEVYRANAKNGKYVKLYTTKNAKKRSFTNGRNLQAGKTYYYKVRGVRTVDGKKYYTKWSNISAKKTR